MRLNIELIAEETLNAVSSKIVDIDIDENKIAQTNAISALSEIQECLKDDTLSDFDAIENIILIFEKYNLDFLPRHDF